MRRTTLFRITVASWVLLAGAAGASAQFDAITQARYDLKIGFTEGGKVAGTPVQPGTRVKKGDLLIELEDKEGAALVAMYRIAAESEVSIHAAEAKHRLAQVEEKRLIALFEERAATSFEVDKAKVSAEVAKYELDYSRQQHQEDLHKFEQAVARHEKFALHAPTDGMVETVLVNEGEMVEALKPVMRMVVIDPLWIDTPVPTVQTLKLKEGDPAWATPNLPGHTNPIRGKILFVAQVADSASDTRLVRVEVPNSEGIPAGGHVTVTFSAPTGVAAARPEGGR